MAHYFAKALVKPGRPIGYAGARNRERSAMDKLETLEELFVGRHFDRDVIISCVRWYRAGSLKR